MSRKHIKNVNVNSVLGVLHRVDRIDVADVSEVHVASIFRVVSADEESMYLRNVGSIAHIQTI
jgi:hypothetical protein